MKVFVSEREWGIANQDSRLFPLKIVTNRGGLTVKTKHPSWGMLYLFWV